jgi:hypothetical protein
VDEAVSIIPGAIPSIWTFGEPEPPGIYEVWVAPDPDYLSFEGVHVTLNHLLVTGWWASGEFERKILPRARRFHRLLP